MHDSGPFQPLQNQPQIQPQFFIRTSRFLGHSFVRKTKTKTFSFSSGTFSSATPLGYSLAWTQCVQNLVVSPKNQNSKKNGALSETFVDTNTRILCLCRAKTQQFGVCARGLCTATDTNTKSLCFDSDTTPIF